MPLGGATDKLPPEAIDCTSPEGVSGEMPSNVYAGPALETCSWSCEAVGYLRAPMWPAPRLLVLLLLLLLLLVLPAPAGGAGSISSSTSSGKWSLGT